MLWFHRKNEQKEYEAQEFQEESGTEVSSAQFFDRGPQCAHSDCCRPPHPDCCRPGCRCPHCCPATGPTGPTAPSIYAQQGKCRNHAAFSTLKTIKQPL